MLFIVTTLLLVLPRTTFTASVFTSKQCSALRAYVGLDGALERTIPSTQALFPPYSFEALPYSTLKLLPTDENICETESISINVTNSIVLLFESVGNCSAQAKVLIAQKSGAIAVLMSNDDDSGATVSIQDDDKLTANVTTTIPMRSISLWYANDAAWIGYTQGNTVQIKFDCFEDDYPSMLCLSDRSGEYKFTPQTGEYQRQAGREINGHPVWEMGGYEEEKWVYGWAGTDAFIYLRDGGGDEEWYWAVTHDSDFTATKDTDLVLRCTVGGKDIWNPSLCPSWAGVSRKGVMDTEISGVKVDGDVCPTCSAFHAFVELYAPDMFGSETRTLLSAQALFPPYAYNVPYTEVIALNSSDDDICDPDAIFTANTTGKVVILFDTIGNCSAHRKVWSAEQHGAVAVLIGHDDGGYVVPVVNAVDDNYNSSIPMRSIPQSTAELLARTTFDLKDELWSTVLVRFKCFDNVYYPSVICLGDPLLEFSDQAGDYQQEADKLVNEHPVWTMKGYEGTDGRYGWSGTDAFIYLRNQDGDEEWYWAITHDSDFTAESDGDLVMRCTKGGKDIWNPLLCPSWVGVNSIGSGGIYKYESKEDILSITLSGDYCPECSAFHAYVELYAPDLIRGPDKTSTLLSAQSLFPPYAYNIPFTEATALPSTDDICDPNAVFTEDLTDKVVTLFETNGNCSIHRKVYSAEQHGAIAVLMANNVELTAPLYITGDNYTTTIPVRSITKTSGENLYKAATEWKDQLMGPVLIRLKCFDNVYYPSALCVSDRSGEYEFTPQTGDYQRQEERKVNGHPVWEMKGYEGETQVYGWDGTDAFIYLRDGGDDEEWYWAITHDSDFTATVDTDIVLRCTVGGKDIWNPSLCPSWAGVSSSGVMDTEISGVKVDGDVCPMCSAFHAFVELYGPDLIRGSKKTTTLLSAQALFPPYAYNVPYTESTALNSTDDICDPNAIFSRNITNKVVTLFETVGNCSIHRKVWSAEQHGAVAVLMANNLELTAPLSIKSDNYTTTIPVRSIPKSSGETLYRAAFENKDELWAAVLIRFKCFDDVYYPAAVCVSDPSAEDEFTAQTGDYQQQEEMKVNGHPVWKMEGTEGRDHRYGYPGTDGFIYLRDEGSIEEWYWAITDDSDFTATLDKGMVLRCTVGGKDIWNPSLCPSWVGVTTSGVLNGYRYTADTASGVTVSSDLCPVCSAFHAFVEIFAPDLIRGSTKTATVLSSQALFPPYAYNLPYTELIVLPNTDDICSTSATFSRDITDKVLVLFESIGDCSIHYKVWSAELHGAAAVLMANNDESGVINIVDDNTLTGEDNTAYDSTTIPMRSITKQRGESFYKASLEWNVPVLVRFKCFDNVHYPSILCVGDPSLKYPAQAGEYQQQAEKTVNDHPVWKMGGDEGNNDEAYGWEGTDAFIYLHNSEGDDDWYWAITHDSTFSATKDDYLVLRCAVGGQDIWNPALCTKWAEPGVLSVESGVTVTDGVCPVCSAFNAYVEVYAPALWTCTTCKTRISTLLSAQALFPPYAYNVPYTESTALISTDDICDPDAIFSQNITNTIVTLFETVGNCSIHRKVYSAEQHGAVAVLMTNNLELVAPLPIKSDNYTTTIPVRSIPKLNGEVLSEAALENSSDPVLIRIKCYDNVFYPSSVCVSDPLLEYPAQSGEYQQQAELEVNDHPVWKMEGYEGLDDGRYGYPGADAFIYLRDEGSNEQWYWAITHDSDFTATLDKDMVIRCTKGGKDIWNPSLCPSWVGVSTAGVSDGYSYTANEQVSGVNVTGDVCPVCSAFHAFVEMYAPDLVRGSVTSTLLSSQALFPPYAYNVPYTEPVALPTTDDICDDAATFTVNVTGKVVVLFETIGDCSIHRKVYSAEQHGAIAVLMTNNDDGYVVPVVNAVGDDDITTTIPVRSIQKQTGELLSKASLEWKDQLLAPVLVRFKCFDNIYYPSIVCLSGHLNGYIVEVGEYQQQADTEVRDHPVWTKAVDTSIYLLDADGDAEWYWVLNNGDDVVLKCSDGGKEIWNPVLCPSWKGLSSGEWTVFDGVNITAGLCGPTVSPTASPISSIIVSKDSDNDDSHNRDESKSNKSNTNWGLIIGIIIGVILVAIIIYLVIQLNKKPKFTERVESVDPDIAETEIVETKSQKHLVTVGDDSDEDPLTTGDQDNAGNEDHTTVDLLNETPN